MSRWCTLTAMVVGVLLMLLTIQPTAPTLVWNASTSVPLGLYRIQLGPVRRGDLVLIHLPPDIAELAHRRGYLPKSAYLIKFVLAVAGDQVCSLGDRILVRGVLVARALHRDRSGRRMLVWHGCRRLTTGEVFLLARHPQSFDSRYFGPVPVSAIVGRAVLLWPAREANLTSAHQRPASVALLRDPSLGSPRKSERRAAKE